MSGKNRKFDRNRKRSPSMAQYRAARRDISNKIKKIKRHVRKHPQDARSESALKNVQSGTVGPVPTFPVVSVPHTKHSPDGVNELEIEFRKHHTTYMNKGGKRKKVVMLDEPAASGPVYCVLAEGVTLDVGQTIENVDTAYAKSKGNTILLERRGDKVSLLRNKPAVSLFSMKERAVYAG